MLEQAWDQLMIDLNAFETNSLIPANNLSHSDSLSDVVSKLTRSLIRHSHKAKVEGQLLVSLVQDDRYDESINTLVKAINKLDYESALHLLHSISGDLILIQDGRNDK